MRFLGQGCCWEQGSWRPTPSTTAACPTCHITPTRRQALELVLAVAEQRGLGVAHAATAAGAGARSGAAGGGGQRAAARPLRVALAA